MIGPQKHLQLWPTAVRNNLADCIANAPTLLKLFPGHLRVPAAEGSGASVSFAPDVGDHPLPLQGDAPLDAMDDAAHHARCRARDFIVGGP